MYIESSRLTIPPLLYDAMSGEFRPPCDGFRQHTLARLICAAAQKGEEVDPPNVTTPEDPRPYNRAFGYEPSWGPGVTATALCNDDHKTLRLDGIVLRGPSDRHISICRGLTPNCLGVQIMTGMGAEFLPLELGPQLEEARLAIAGAAQEFFNRLETA